MGKKSRRRRAEEKRLCRQLGYKYKSYEAGADGELKRPKMSKAEHRRRFLRRKWLNFMEGELVDILTRKAVEDIQAAEDAAFVAIIDQAVGAHEATSP